MNTHKRGRERRRGNGKRESTAKGAGSGGKKRGELKVKGGFRKNDLPEFCEEDARGPLRKGGVSRKRRRESGGKKKGAKSGPSANFAIEPKTQGKGRKKSFRTSTKGRTRAADGKNRRRGRRKD